MSATQKLLLYHAYKSKKQHLLTEMLLYRITIILHYHIMLPNVLNNHIFLSHAARPR